MFETYDLGATTANYNETLKIIVHQIASVLKTLRQKRYCTFCYSQLRNSN